MPEPTINLNERKRYTVFFTIEPLHKLTDFDGTDDSIATAVTEAEILARVLEHNPVAPMFLETVRGLLFFSCMTIAKALEQHKPVPEMMRDIYPYARIIEGQGMSELFNNFAKELREVEPELFKSILEVMKSEQA